MIFEPTAVLHPRHEIRLLADVARMASSVCSEAEGALVGALPGYEVHKDNLESVFRRVIDYPTEPLPLHRILVLLGGAQEIAKHAQSMILFFQAELNKDLVPEFIRVEVRRQHDVGVELYTRALSQTQELIALLERAAASLEAARQTLLELSDADTIADHEEEIQNHLESLRESKAKEREARQRKRERAAELTQAAGVG